MLTQVLLLAGCATMDGPVKPQVNDNGCSWARPIYVDCNDVLTNATSKQIRDHDEAGAKVCGWKRLPAKKCAPKAPSVSSRNQGNPMALPAAPAPHF